MSIESSTVGGRTKVKIVLLGDQSVGKSAIIEKFVNDKFTEIGCVISKIFSPQLALTF